MKKILITGTFDILHPGHISLFNQAKKLGDFLIAVVARDSTVAKVKGKQPHHNQNQRVRHLKKIKLINRVVLGNPGDKLKVIEQQKPDIIGLGYDQHIFTKNLRTELKKRGLTPRIMRLRAFKPRQYKSSILKKAAR
ncbi:MAG: adenylyltransferase/cytidyltransferase family protein [Patescibacteria group bacterium]